MLHEVGSALGSLDQGDFFTATSIIYFFVLGVNRTLFSIVNPIGVFQVKLLELGDQGVD